MSVIRAARPQWRPSIIRAGADQPAARGRDAAISVHADGLYRVLKHFPSSAVTTILDSPNSRLTVGSTTPQRYFTGALSFGVYRKFHPAMNRSVYTAGSTAQGQRFG